MNKKAETAAENEDQSKVTKLIDPAGLNDPAGIGNDSLPDEDEDSSKDRKKSDFVMEKIDPAG